MLKFYMNYNFLKNNIKKNLKQIDELIENYINENDPLHKQYLNKTSLKNGKKVRPIFLFLLSGLFNINDKNIITIASSLELLHVSSLVHDDIIDKTDFRRGKKTFSSVFGNDISLLWGDFLFLTALKLLNTINNPLLTNSMLEASIKMVKGQILELENTNNLDINIETYLKIIEYKTAALFNFIGNVMIILSNANNKIRKDILEFTNNIGIQFQIIDDILDIYSDKTGKDKFNDFREKKITLPYILLLKKISKKEFLKITNEKELINYFEKYDIKSDINNYIDKIYKDTIKFLNKFESKVEKEALMEFINFIKERRY